MPSLQIRDLPDDVYEMLSYRARRHGRSLAKQALADLRAMNESDRSERRRRVLERLAARGVRPDAADWPDPVEMIRRGRRM